MINNLDYINKELNRLYQKGKNRLNVAEHKQLELLEKLKKEKTKKMEQTVSGRAKLASIKVKKPRTIKIRIPKIKSVKVPAIPAAPTPEIILPEQKVRIATPLDDLFNNGMATSIYNNIVLRPEGVAYWEEIIRRAMGYGFDVERMWRYEYFKNGEEYEDDGFGYATKTEEGSHLLEELAQTLKDWEEA